MKDTKQIAKFSATSIDVIRKDDAMRTTVMYPISSIKSIELKSINSADYLFDDKYADVVNAVAKYALQNKLISYDKWAAIREKHGAYVREDYSYDMMKQLHCMLYGEPDIKDNIDQVLIINMIDNSRVILVGEEKDKMMASMNVICQQK